MKTLVRARLPEAPPHNLMTAAQVRRILRSEAHCSWEAAFEQAKYRLDHPRFLEPSVSPRAEQEED
ncbi:MAG TPA: hypothetical protein VLI05_02435 [Candidatus Saccharimonadia bacterium]|nr:hypothetical protein [Candidatus Saccharimonadia bacterium]